MVKIKESITLLGKCSMTKPRPYSDRRLDEMAPATSPRHQLQLYDAHSKVLRQRGLCKCKYSENLEKVHSLLGVCAKPSKNLNKP